MTFASGSSKTIRKSNHMEDCLTQMMFNKSLNNDREVMIGTALSTLKKAARNKLTNLIGHLVLSTRMTSKDTVSIGQKKEY